MVVLTGRRAGKCVIPVTVRDFRLVTIPDRSNMPATDRY